MAVPSIPNIWNLGTAVSFRTFTYAVKASEHKNIK